MQPRETSSPRDDRSKHAGPLDRAATAITFSLSPPVLVPALLWIVLGWVGAPPGETAALVGTCTVLIGIVPISFLVWMVRSGRSRTLNLEDRRHRSHALGVAIVGGLVFTVITVVVSETERVLVVGMVVAYLLSIGTLAAVNRYWRISLHAASAGAFGSVILFLAVGYPAPAGLPVTASILTVIAAVLIALVSWSRWQLRAHTPAQLLAGTVVGLIVPYAVLAVLTSALGGGAGS